MSTGNGGRLLSATTSDIKLAGDRSVLSTEQVYLIPHFLVSRKYVFDNAFEQFIMIFGWFGREFAHGGDCIANIGSACYISIHHFA